MYSLQTKQQAVELVQKLRDVGKFTYQKKTITSFQDIADVLGVKDESSVRKWMKLDLSEAAVQERFVGFHQ